MIRRRSFLLATGTAAGVAALGWRVAYVPELNGVTLGGNRALFFDQGVGARMLALLDTLAPADKLGQAWLASLPRAPELMELMLQLVARLDLHQGSLEAVLQQRVREDFISGDRCNIDGWQLSLTECQLAGLRQLAVSAGLLRAKVASEQGDAGYSNQEIATLDNWGPRHTLQGQTFNQQLDGHSGLWFKLSGAPGHAKIMIDGEISSTSVSDKTVTSGLHGATQERILATPGKYEIALVDPIRKTRQHIGYFEVRGGPPEASGQISSADEFCEVLKWGPRETRAGEAVNEQPDGSMGVWLHTRCLPRGTQLFFGDDPLKYHRQAFGLTTSVPLALLGAPGRIPLSLQHPDTGEKRVFGHLLIQ